MNDGPPRQREPELKGAADEVKRLSRIARNLPRFPIAHRLCHQLLEHRDGLVVDGMAEWWLDDIAEVVDSRTTDLEKANLTDLLENCVREIHRLARERNQPATTTDEARQALTAATDFVHRPLPPIPRQRPRSQTGTPTRRLRRRTRGGRPTD
ncbi:hypothetical protein HW130_33285 [Streptomyces sp. PKU-EA00015]|uniref:hypothetical protein n=1 Tax=Streptomyces sp. PKU-EA00015 TaxID=2748326 RepID=UPI0015A02D7A|nr:hypothetical protein [Streptomyces sp. PKU-EA00015]NWF31062.1 hypothetical protein [Streptomyces sp. PKU-EA00015]